MDQMREIKRGSTVSAVNGSVWLTQHKDHADYVMRSGESAQLNGAGTTLIYAFADSAVCFAVAP